MLVFQTRYYDFNPMYIKTFIFYSYVFMEINGKQAGEVFRTRHAQGRDGKLGNYRLCRRQESSGPPEGNLPDVPAKDERKYANRTDPPDKR